MASGSSSRLSNHTSSMPAANARPVREFYPDTMSVQRKSYPWEDHMEWLIFACLDLLATSGLHEHNLLAVSTVDEHL